MSYVLGVDIGSTSSKAILASAQGEVIATAACPHAVAMPHPGWAEHDADRVWWHDVRRLARQLLADKGLEVTAVCVSGIGPCALVTGTDSRPLRPAILYGIDTRASHEIEILAQRLGPTPILDTCGSALTSQAVGPKLLWLQEHEPSVWQAARRLYMASSFIVQRLCGAYILDHHSASQAVPLYDLRRQSWHRDWAQSLAGPIQLPELVWPMEQVGRVSAAAAADTGITEGAVVCAGSIDAWAEAVSVGMRDPGDTCVMYGSTTFLVQQVETFSPDPRLWTTAGILPGSITVAAGMATTGSVTNWFRDLCGGPSWASLFAAAERVEPGSMGLLVLPYFAGERTPIFDARARGAIIGLTLRHQRPALFRAILEGVAYGIRHNLEVMGQVTGLPPRLLATGGGSMHRLWLQIVSDVTGYTQTVPHTDASAAHGAVLMAIGDGGATSRSRGDEQRVVEPQRRLRRQYDEIYQLYRAAYEQARSTMHGLARVQEAAGREGGGAAVGGHGEQV